MMNPVISKYSYTFLFLFFITLLLSSCSVGPKPIAFGTDHCDYCAMTISDNRFGAELVTKKGRVYKFDDLHCLKGFINDKTIINTNIHSLWVVDFSMPGNLTNAENCFLLHNDKLQSPMGSNTAAFASQDSLDTYFSKYEGDKLKWQEFISAE